MKVAFHYINESLYSYENEFINNAKFDFTNIQKAFDDCRNKLKDAKIGDLPEITKEFMIQIIEDIKNKTEDLNINIDISANSQYIALKNELNSTITKAKKEVETNENFIPLLLMLNTTKNTLYDMYNKTIEMPLIKSLINKTISALQTVSNTKLSDIKEYSDKSKAKVTEEINNLKKIDKTSERIRYLVNKYYIENNATVNTIDLIINKTKVNDLINQFIFSVVVVENYFNEPITKSETESYNKSKEVLQQKVETYNISEGISQLNETISQDIHDTSDLIKLLLKKYKSLPDRESKSQLTKRIIALLKEEREILNITGKVFENNPILKEFVDKVSAVLTVIKDTLPLPEMPDNMTEFLEILKDSLNTAKIQINNTLQDMKGKNISEIVKDVTAITNNKVKETTKEGLKKILESEKINNIKNNQKIMEIIGKLNNNKIIGSQFAQQMANFVLLIKNLNATAHSNDDKFYEGIKENIKTYFNNMNLKNISEIMNGIYENGFNFTEYIEIVTNINSLIFELYKEVGYLPKIYTGIKNIGKEGLRFLSINKKEKKIKMNNRRTDSTGNLLCKFDGTFSESQVLTASAENINSYLLKSSASYNLVIKSNINIQIDKDMADKCTSNNIATIFKNTEYKNSSTLKIEHTKKRFYFTMRIRTLSTLKIPSFFYLKLKGRLMIKARNLRFLDTDEEVDSFCVLEDETNKDNATFSCFGYNDNINENNANNKITLYNITSEYIELPGNSSISNIEERDETDTTKTTSTKNWVTGKSNSSGLKAGAIVGIVIACVAVLAIVTGIIIYLKKNSSKPKSLDMSDSRNDLQVPNEI